LASRISARAASGLARALQPKQPPKSLELEMALEPETLRALPELAALRLARLVCG
jgi:hypothetical protein